ncbi:hypothetical protein ACJRO7_016614 [Eucalyptus globulus]|uniref:AP180 N-terminal homology (ANTH) domain-containing protein n=1 Tax=Eucalyptus globulus TaxID=34317 RepID=A0ABD3L7M2_EUCGL
MSQSTIRITLGAVKDQTSIGLAKVMSNTAPELEVNIMKATSHDDDPTHDYIVALKSLVVIRRLLNDRDPIFREEIMYATRRGARLLNLAVLLDKFFNMEYHDCVKALDAYASAAKQIDELIAFYNWCKDTGVARLSEYPEVQMIASKLLETMEEFVRDRAKRPTSPERREELPPVAQEEEPMVRQHVNTAQLTGGSASSVALPGLGKSATPVLALPAPDGTVQTVNQDPFAASLGIPPPSYVQMAKMKKKQHLVIGGTGYYAPDPPVMPYGMPPAKGMDRQQGISILLIDVACLSPYDRFFSFHPVVYLVILQYDPFCILACGFWEEGRVNPGRFFSGKIFGCRLPMRHKPARASCNNQNFHDHSLV